MSKTRNVVKNLKIETARAERKCHVNSKHVIAPGEQHLAQYDDAGSRENICMACAPKVLATAEKHLQSIRDELGA